MIWIIGSKGMLGQELSEHFEECGVSWIGSDLDVDILDSEKLAQFSQENEPSWIVNCSAYTAVDKAEGDSERAFEINEKGVKNIANLAKALDIPLIHISTDYVFDGTSSIPLGEDSKTGPIGIYGKSKLAGEKAIQTTTHKYFILRTAWLYGKFGPNFVFTMLKLMKKLDQLKVVSDQIGSPTWTRILTTVVCRIVQDQSDSYGVYHLSGEGKCSWYEFAAEIYRIASDMELLDSECQINPCSSDEFPTAAKRPAYSLLSKEKVKDTFDYDVPRWEDSIAKFITDIKSKGIEIK